MEKSKKIDVIMPTINKTSIQYLKAKNSLIGNTKAELRFFEFPDNMDNLGWMGFNNYALKKILDNDDSDYIILVNDDILMYPMNDWAVHMKAVMDSNEDIGAMSCLTNKAMGFATVSPQNFCMKIPYVVPFLSFYFVMIKKEAIKKTGLLDEDLIGGDDLDYCSRLKDNGYRFVVTPQIFCWHEYGQTGKKLYGDFWDSKEHSEKIRIQIIKKHGFEKIQKLMEGL